VWAGGTNPEIASFGETLDLEPGLAIEDHGRHLTTAVAVVALAG
jgi:hypothetical protein